jgi:hypothetical protein
LKHIQSARANENPKAPGDSILRVFPRRNLPQADSIVLKQASKTVHGLLYKIFLCLISFGISGTNCTYQIVQDNINEK